MKQGSRRRSGDRRGPSRSEHRRPRFEPLEERRLLAITVNTLVDELDGSIVDGDVSLRDAIFAAPIGETINFDPALNGATILLTLGELSIDSSMTIDASNLPARITIDASASDPTPASNNGDGSRVLRITDGAATDAKVELRGLTLTGGDVKGSGGAIQSFESLSLVDVTIEGNSARGAQGQGGGVWAQSVGTLTITGSTIAGNSAQLDGGGIWLQMAGGAATSIFATTIADNVAGFNGGGAYAAVAGGSLTIRDSTVSGNSSSGDGGGIYARTTGAGATRLVQNTISGNSANWRGGGVFASALGANAMVIAHSTITANVADADANNPVIETGGGIYFGDAGALTLEHSIVAANTDRGDNIHDLRVAGGTLSARFNLIGRGAGSGLGVAPVGDANGNIVGASVGIDPGLAPLGDNGGPTHTHALLFSSPALNRGDASLTSESPALSKYDQRGAPFDRIDNIFFVPRIDIGAVELGGVTDIDALFVDTTEDVDDGNLAPGDFSLREALRVARELTVTPTIKFAASMAGQRINLRTELVITGNFDIDASELAERVTINAGGGSFRAIRTEGDVRLAGLEIRGGVGALQGGGGILGAGRLTVTDCLLRDNRTASDSTAGAAISMIGIGSSLAVIRSVLTGNTAKSAGSVLYAQIGEMTIVDSQIIDNVGLNGIAVIRANELDVIRSEISRNSGGVTVSDIMLADSTIEDNIGAAIMAGPRVEMTRTLIRNNAGGGVRLSLPANQSGLVEVTDSAIVGNSASGSGGGISVAGILGQIVVTNSTISGNRATGEGGGIYTGIPLVLRNSTVTANRSDSDANGAGSGGGIFVARQTQGNKATIENSIVSGNIDSTATEPDVQGLATARYSVIGIDNPAIGTAPTNAGGALVGSMAAPLDPLLGPLTDNGGPTPSHALLAGSIAIDAGDPLYSGLGKFDQRSTGYNRVFGPRVDMGAIEFGSLLNTSPTFTSPASATIAENGDLQLPVVVVDLETPEQVAITILSSGTDGAKFELIENVLRFRSPPDFDLPGDVNRDNVYFVRLRADDGNGGVATQELTVTVTPLNDNVPVFQSRSTASVVEGSIPVFPVTATDADVPHQTILYSIFAGDDATKFNLTPSGSLSFVDPPSHAAPTDANGDNVYLVTVEAFDGAGGSAFQQIAVTVIAAEPPDANADFDGDGAVNAADLSIWRQNYGTTGGPDPTPGDADGDRDVDGADFLTWQRTLGQVVHTATLQTTMLQTAPSAADGGAAYADVEDASLFTLGKEVILAAPSTHSSAPGNQPPRRRPEHRPPMPAAVWTSHNVFDRIATSFGAARRDSSAAQTENRQDASPQLADAVFSAGGLLNWPLFDSF